MSLSNFVRKNKKTLQILAGIVVLALIGNYLGFLAWPAGYSAYNRIGGLDIGETRAGYWGETVKCVSSGSSSSYLYIKLPWGESRYVTVSERVDTYLYNPANKDEKYLIWPSGCSSSGVSLVVNYWKPVPPPTEPTPTATKTPTPTPTKTPSPTPTKTPLPTPTKTPIPTPTPTPTVVKTVTPTPVVTPTKTISPTPTKTPVPTLYPTTTATMPPTEQPTETETSQSPIETLTPIHIIGAALLMGLGYLILRKK